MKKFSIKRWRVLWNKLGYTEGLFPQICGYLTPVEIKTLLDMGMRIPDRVWLGFRGNKEDVLHLIKSGDCRSMWIYFKLGPHNPAFVSYLKIRKREE